MEKNLELKKSGVPLEEALDAAGTGLYTWYAIVTSGIISFAALVHTQGMAFAMPMAGCEMGLSFSVRGMMNSMGFTGMLVSAQIFGFLADKFGRKCIMMCSQMATVLITILWSFAPDTTSLGIVLFCNGIFLTGTFTSVHVYIGEICPSHMRSKGLMIMSAMMAFSNVYLPAMAWAILPLGVSVPIFGKFVFTSWRLYILLMLVPLSLAIILLSRLPETPKFLYTIGKYDETLEVIRSIYAVNQRKDKDQFPIYSLELNPEEKISNENQLIRTGGNQLIRYFKMMVTDFALLFSKQYVIFTLMSSFILFSLVGVCYTLIMWFPEQTSDIMRYHQFHESLNVTICDLMEESNSAETLDCNIDYDFMYSGIILGIAEVITCLAVGQWALKINRKILMCIFAFLSAGICFVTIFLTSHYLIILSLASMIVLLFPMYPLIIGIVMDFFPTKLRSNAASLTSTFARLGSTTGGQLLGITFESHCTAGYFGIMTALIGGGILCILIPTGKKNQLV